MTYGNGVRDDSQQLRDIQDLIAKLEDLNRKLAQPKRTMTTMAMPAPAAAPEAEPADVPSAS